MDRLSKAALALVLIAAAGVAVAQYPVKPIRLVVGFPPGGSADPTTRIIGAGSCARQAYRWSSARAPWIRGSDI